MKGYGSPRGIALVLSLASLCPAGSASGQEPAPQEDSVPISAEGSFTQFWQGPAIDDGDTESEYGGRLDVEVKLDTHKLGLWPDGTFTAKAVTRYGDSFDDALAAAVPVNAALITPGASGTVTALIALNYTHLIELGDPGDVIALQVGKFDGFDLVTEPFLGGGGITKWMNLAQAIPPHEARNIPSLTPLAFLAGLILGGETRAGLAVLDPDSETTSSGLDDLFEHGVTLVPSVVFPTHFFGKAGHQELRATWSNQEVTPFDQIPRLKLPPRIRSLDPVSSSWTLTYTGDQYISERPGIPRSGWGVFWLLGLGDEDTNPIPFFANVGVAGSSPISGRARDEFGIAYGYAALSDQLQEVIDPLISIQDEWEIELYYTLEAASWINATADFQIVQPFRDGEDTVFLPGIRLQLVF